MSADPTIQDLGVLTLERRGHVLLIGLDRPEKRNAFDLAMLEELGLAYEELDRDDDLRLRRAVRARRPLHGRPRPRRGRPRGSPTERSRFPEDGPRPAGAATASVDQARGRRRAGLVPDARHRAALAADIGVAAATRASRRSRSSAASSRSAARPSGCRGWPVGQRDALAADRRRVRRGGGAPHRPRPGGHRPRRAARRAGRSPRRIAARPAPLGVRATLASAHRAPPTITSGRRTPRDDMAR